jgi:hypothetical protein
VLQNIHDPHGFHQIQHLQKWIKQGGVEIEVNNILCCRDNVRQTEIGVWIEKPSRLAHLRRNLHYTDNAECH